MHTLLCYSKTIKEETKMAYDKAERGAGRPNKKGRKKVSKEIKKNTNALQTI